ncbi:MAG: HAD-IA family hydrolase [Spirulina sp. SIO3F2]|nr:HAD-IA family hydrolase [Spirulina sp. SIO3F2]
MTHPPVVLFDFDGTIADTHTVFVQIINRLADEFGYEPASPEKVKQMQGLTAQNIIRQSGISVFKIPLLLRRLKRELHQEMKQVQTIAGMDDAIRQLHTQGYQLGIVTSNWIENVRLFLELQALTDCFIWTYSSSTLFGKHRMLNRFIKQSGLNSQCIVYVGDESRDIEAAQASGIDIISVAWGFNAPELLAAYKPTALITEAQELLPTVQRLFNT